MGGQPRAALAMLGCPGLLSVALTRAEDRVKKRQVSFDFVNQPDKQATFILPSSFSLFTLPSPPAKYTVPPCSERYNGRRAKPIVRGGASEKRGAKLCHR